MIDAITNLLPVPDIIALLWLVGWWAGYTLVTDKVGRHKRALAQVLDSVRQQWMQRMLERENRMADVNIIIAHHRSGALLTSTTILIMAGIVAVLGNVDRLAVILDQFSFTVLASRELIELKVVVLLLIFIYAFFKFAWSLRQHNTALVLIGAAPLPADKDDDSAATYPKQAARLLTRASGNFNRGIRAYYFALATLAWFVQPWLFMVAVIAVIAVNYRRDYRSVTLNTLVGGDDRASS